MYSITKEVYFCYGHRLMLHTGKCRHLHGHSVKAAITIRRERLDEQGMVCDFADVRDCVEAYIDTHLDHNFLLHRDDPIIPLLVQQNERFLALDEHPTAEVLAKLLKEGDLLALSDRPRSNAAGIAFTLDLIRPFVGVPYQWGGRSPFGYDCAGLAQIFWGFMGVPIPRDADQQFRAGQIVKGPPRPGDLLFFSGDDSKLSEERHQHITHVAISLGNDDLIHSNGGSWNIACNSLNPASPIYRADLRDSFAGASRF